MSAVDEARVAMFGSIEIDHAAFAFSDVGNAERLTSRWRNRIRFVREWDAWIVWNGKVWEEDSHKIRELAIDVAKDIVRASDAIEDDDKRKKVVGFGLASQGRSRLDAMAEVAKAIPAVHVSVNDLDSDPMLLAVDNGTIDLRDGELLPHRREDMLTRMLPHVYDASATCPTWEAFLDRVLGGDTELVSWIQRAIGYSLTGDVSEHVFLVMYGGGQNGKGVFTRALQSLLGSYSVAVNDTLVIAKQGAFGSSVRDLEEVGALKGKRAAIMNETPKDARFNENRVKVLTGGDTLRGGALYRDSFEFVPTHKLWIATNNKPATLETNEAMRRRLRLVPFEVTIPKEERNRNLGAELDAEMTGILAWAVRGCLDWHKAGLGTPPAVQKATDSYFDEQDPVRRWIDACCEVGAGERCLLKVLLPSFNRFVDRKQMTEKTLGGRLVDLGYRKGRSAPGAVIYGLGLDSAYPIPVDNDERLFNAA